MKRVLEAAVVNKSPFIYVGRVQDVEVRSQYVQFDLSGRHSHETVQHVKLLLHQLSYVVIAQPVGKGAAELYKFMQGLAPTYTP